MADLRALLSRLGFTDVVTLLQSGNAVFHGHDGLPDELASLERSAAAPTHDPEEAERKRRQAIAEAEALRRRLLNPKGPIL